MTAENNDQGAGHPPPALVEAPPLPLPPESDGWSVYEKFVLAELQRGGRERADLEKKLDKHMEQSSKNHTDMKVEIASLKVRSSIWGGLSGLGAALLAMAVAMAKFFGIGSN